MSAAAVVSLADRWYAKNKKRLQGQKREVFEALSDGKWHTQSDLLKVSHKFGARISDLRDDGWRIDAHPTGGGSWIYRLHSFQGTPKELA